MRRIMLSLALLLIAADVGRSDFSPGPPPPPPAKTAVARLEITNRSEVTRLLIPRRLLAHLQSAALPANPGTTGARLTSLPNLAIGLSLTAALTLAGFIGFRRPRRAVTIAMLVVAVGIGAAAVVSPSLAQYYQPPLPLQQPASLPSYTLHGNMIVEVVDDSDDVRVLLHKDTPLLYVGPKRFN